MNEAPTLLGHVLQVTGASVRVKQIGAVASGLAMIDGRAYRIGQVGAFVRIPQGYTDLLGVVDQVGATAVPEEFRPSEPHGELWLGVQLIGESIGLSFERGISQHPAINDEVHLVTEGDLRRIYGEAQAGQVAIGHLASSASIEVRLDLGKLITRHSAVLGSTGTGKSTTVATLLRAIAAGRSQGENPLYPRARILLLDLHGEYARALSDVSQVFRVGARGTEEHELHIPYWALGADDLLGFLFGAIADEKAVVIRDKLVDLKTASLEVHPRDGASTASLTADTPIPFSLKRLWYEFIYEEIATFEGKDRNVRALVEPGDAETLTLPTYKPWAAGQVFLAQNAPGIRRQLDHLRSRLLDHSYDFLLHPGNWEPNAQGEVKCDLDVLLQGWLGHDRAITILDLSGVPSAVLIRLIGALLRVIYETLFWSRARSGGGVDRPLLVVMEEAHLYLGRDQGGPAGDLARRIVKEGRKYGIGAMLVSQRPSEVDETILSQCGTFIALRLSNPTDRERVRGTVPDSLAGFLDMLPVLRTGEAIITGEAARLPMRVRVALPSGELPDSEDPDVPGRWAQARIQEDYRRMIAAWRAQHP